MERLDVITTCPHCGETMAVTYYGHAKTFVVHCPRCAQTFALDMQKLKEKLNVQPRP